MSGSGQADEIRIRFFVNALIFKLDTCTVEYPHLSRSSSHVSLQLTGVRVHGRRQRLPSTHPFRVTISISDIR